jgi:hypothetical protein
MVKERQYSMSTDAGGIEAVCERSSLTLRPPGRGRWYDMKDQGISARQIVHLLDSLACVRTMSGASFERVV